MPGVGTFHNRDVVLEWIGRSQRNGQDCALIQYQAFFNPWSIANGGMTLNGRSDYWGQILGVAGDQANRIRHASTRRCVGEMKLAGQDTTQIINVFRIGTFEPVNASRGHVPTEQWQQHGSTGERTMGVVVFAGSTSPWRWWCWSAGRG